MSPLLQAISCNRLQGNRRCITLNGTTRSEAEIHVYTILQWNRHTIQFF